MMATGVDVANEYAKASLLLFSQRATLCKCHISSLSREVACRIQRRALGSVPCLKG